MTSVYVPYANRLSARAMAPIKSTSAYNASNFTGLAQGWVAQLMAVECSVYS